MFTGLIQELGILDWRHLSPTKMEVWISAPTLFQKAQLGDSVCVNGVCLTIEELKTDKAKFFISIESLERSNLGKLTEGNQVNLELALQAHSFLGGHYVQGHVDACGKVTSIIPGDGVRFIYISLPHSVSRYLVEKASITINGVSLTVNSVQADEFGVCIIPKTLEKTNLALLQVGDEVNIEVDILSKYVELHLQNFLKARTNKNENG